ncbi:GerAB/ArcD/ProY family transporter [Neobacillus sp. PS3-12]|jgi:spore germination protein KB|uniref:GerAB/ArcD/ProY family transporter n=1 Tax=Neobacillus sp. PS3-12 TaxID=3070677 RepID=UPI0027DFF0A3|nr:GerAB/ArcD/ProY family transporter [Neobacillus sp. PS3-12]WML52515.1 GerAB/ArcD/ProY family transporter [Neobacillus sp. PS3-12]
MENKLRFISIIYTILLSVGLFAHVEIIPFLLTTAKRDAWISIVLTVIILPLWIYLLFKIVDIVKNRSIIKLLNDHSTLLCYYSLLLPIALYMLLDAFFTAKEIIYWSQLSYMQGFNSFILAVALLIFCLLCTESGFFSIGLLSSLLCPFVLLLGFFISFANIKKKHYELLFPLFTDGYVPITKGLIFSSLPILELFIIIFLTPLLRKTVSRKQILIVGLVIIGLMLGPTMAAIEEFGPEQASMYRYPAYEQWRLISIGRYFSHTDFFAIYQWISGGVIRISLFVLISCRILTKDNNNHKIVRMTYLILFIACIYPFDQSTLASFIYGYFRPFSFLLLTIQIFILALFIVKNKQKWLGGSIHHE